jgi:predicted ATPase
VVILDEGEITGTVWHVLHVKKSGNSRKMTKYLDQITGIIPNTQKEISIHLNGKNLIIIGSNGSGKTSFVKAIFEKSELLIAKKKQADLSSLKASLVSYENYLKSLTAGTSDQHFAVRNFNGMKSEIDEITSGMQLTIPDNVNFSAGIDAKTAMIKLFAANRAANITHAAAAHGLKTDQKDANNSSPGNSLEQHLLNLKTRGSFALSEKNDAAQATTINAWFAHFEKNLQELMEDSSTMLLFDADRLKFSISQDSKPPFTFQTLSSGYAAIFDIYADLLMRTEYFAATPAELSGLVFIDEIDAHLHVSLQRLIFPFLEKSFPKIQFIVTTHSPFVLMSVNDAVIFDISRNEQVEGDLSLYSYAAVIEGLLGTKPTSKLLDDVINEIATIAAAENKDYDRLKQLLGQIKDDGKKLDSRYRAFYMLGVNALLDRDDQ